MAGHELLPSNTEKLSVNTTDLQSVDKLSSPERPKLKLTKTIAIPGPSNVGKDVLVAELQRRHGWKIFDGTEIGFKRRKNDAQKYIERKEDAHRIFDTKQARRYERLTLNDQHELHQTRLSGIILAEEKDKWSKKYGHVVRKNEWLKQHGKPGLPLPPEIPAISILLWARKEVRIDRAYDQALGKWLLQQEKLSTGEIIDKSDILKKPIKKEIESEINYKDKKNVLDWAPHHQKYIKPGEDPFNRYLKRPNSGPVYDYFLDNSELTIEETADEFERILLLAGAAEIINNDTPKSDDSSGVGLGNGFNNEMPQPLKNVENILVNFGEPMPSRNI